MSRACHLALLVLAAGCNLITGVDEFEFGGANLGASGAGGAAGGQPAGGAGASSTGGAGGEEVCDVTTQKECDRACVPLLDPAHGCDNASCAACAEGSSCCPDCTNTSSDPKRCGDCNRECDVDEWCVASACACRPGLVRSGQRCVDPLSDPASISGGHRAAETIQIVVEFARHRCEGGYIILGPLSNAQPLTHGYSS